MISKNKIFIIAEAGVNHNGSIKIAMKLVDSAVECKADAIKFQTWKKGELTGKYSVKVDYINKNSSKKISRYELSNSYRLTFKEFRLLEKYCKKRGIIFLTTPDGFESLKFVNEVLNVPAIKIGSTELNNLEFISAASKTNKPVILSTGMGTLKEVEEAVNIIKKNNKRELYVLQCTSEYPTKINNVNLNVLSTFKKKLNVNIGFSDHTVGYDAAMLSVAYGVKIIEKHFTLGKKMKGPDHKSSMNPSQLKNFIKKIRLAETIIGSKSKRPTPNEIKNIKGVRRGLVAARNIKKGELLNKSMLVSKRPYINISPNEVYKVVGKKIKNSIKKDQPITWKNLI
tara:strand:- start:3460 stop:4482 length:1023 start_codon:yes stop_codon:yes gene_type:complete